MTACKLASGVAGVAALVALWPQRALGLCPNCLGQRSALSPTLELVGLFLLVPFVIVLVVHRLLRRALRDRGGGGS